MNKLAEKVKSLFTEDLVKLVIGFEKGSHGVRPFFCRNIEEADKLVWDDFCTNNIAVYLTKTELFGTDKTALFANLPALRTILQHSVRKSIEAGAMDYSHIECSGRSYSVRQL